MKITKSQLIQIIKEEINELEDPRSPSPMSYEYEGAADDFRKQIMNLVLQLGPLGVISIMQRLSAVPLS